MAVMESSTKRIPSSEWLRRKSVIRRMYLGEKRSLKEIIQALAYDGFNPSENQLEYQLKLWGIHKNIPKRLAEATWQYIGYEIAARKARGEDTEVVVFGQVQGRKKIETETRRWYKFRYGGEPVPRLPEGISILLRKPSSSQPVPWPSALPWLQFQSKYVLPLRIRPLHSPWMGMPSASNIILDATLVTRRFAFQPSPYTSQLSLASLFEATVPESYPGEASNRANIILSGCRKQALEEQVIVLIFHLSNKMVRAPLEWDTLVCILECSGMMSEAMVGIDKSAATLLATREMLFQLSFMVILSPRLYGIFDINVSISRILKIIRWLLESGQSADTAVATQYGPITPLQIAAKILSKELLIELFKHGASNINLTRCEYAHPWDLPPLFIAAHFACQVDDLSVLDLLIASGATISHHSVMQYGFLSKVTFMTLLAGKKDEDIGLDIMKMAIATFADIAFDGGAQDFDATDILISAASRGNVKILKFLYDNKFSMTGANPFGLTALHAAAYEGQIKCCKFLLECGVGTGYCNPAIPSPIHLACYQNRAKVVKLLHMHGMRIDCKLSIPEKQRALVLQRYFCHNGPKMLSLLNRSESYKLATVTNILQRLQSPIDAVLYTDWERFARGVASSRRPPFFSHDYRSRSTLVSYLVRNGAAIPSSAVSCAAFYVDTELLSLALRSGIDPNANYWRPYSHWSSLGLSLLKHDNPKRRAELATILLNNGYKVAEADVEYAIRFGDIRLVRKTLRYFLHDDCHPPSLGPSMLEAALEVGGSLTIQEVLKYDLVCYSPSLLCVATYRAVTGLINSEVVSQILRLRSQDSTSKESIKIESTAVGIAACYEDMEILDLLLAHVPVSNIAYTSISISEILTEIEGIHGSHMKNVIENAYSKPGNTSRHHLCCSVLVYALDSSSEILHKLLDHGYKFDWIGVAIMTRLRRCDWHVNIPLDHTMVIRDDVGPNLALRWVIESGNIAQIRSLLQLCGPPENGMIRLGCYGGPLQVAIEIGSLEIFNALLEEGISPHAPAEGYNGMTALQAAAIFGRVGLAKLLIDLEVDVNAPGGRDDGRTALEGAAEHGHIDIIELLLQAGVAITGLGQRQYLRAIRFALSQCHYAAADMLKRYRKLSQEEVSMLDEKNLIRELPGLSYFCAPETEPPFSDCASSWSDCTEEEGRNFDVTSLDNSEAQTDEDFGVSNTETTFDEQEFHQKRQQEGEDISVIDIGIVADDLNLFGDGNSPMNELNSVPDITAPSEGIYNFDYPLFGIHEVQCDVEEEI